MKRYRTWLRRQLSRPHGPLGPLMGTMLDIVNRQLNARVITVLEPAAGERVLDLGFGGGEALALMRARHPDTWLAGAEVSTSMLRRARWRFRKDVRRSSMELREASASALPWPDESFDGAISVHSIYFWPDMGAGLRELYRVLRPGGRLVLGVEAPRHTQRLDFAADGFHVPSYDDIATALGRAGFRAMHMLEDTERGNASIRAERP
ncbi:class I SAM-dependent methyltransferase [Haliangium ochraceum]|uniref:Methyltransferase type 11 n=1 Tax=Haliangium ochraceum (strain DSM 14365 / JCM 11303 / SMP-2) TaxID=502025 RepID=D0LIF7_HALO1|nr:class I SAM-dependent methyltransferase [Haliangium ochraceum]ACY18313.1 Methyltransferase type 11 [Haliangium ochraceum DSM 14365]